MSVCVIKCDDLEISYPLDETLQPETKFLTIVGKLEKVLISWRMKNLASEAKLAIS